VILISRARHGPHVCRWHQACGPESELQERPARLAEDSSDGGCDKDVSWSGSDSASECYHECDSAFGVCGSANMSDDRYDTIKDLLLASGYFTDSIPTHILTATLGGTVAVTACAPVDVMKSRIQASTNPNMVGPGSYELTYSVCTPNCEQCIAE
jgi:hypothetical protein